MAWSQLSIDKPHLVYIILGGFTTLFMLVSSVIKEKVRRPTTLVNHLPIDNPFS